ncbi:MAG: Na+/H+ antiporter subunit E [Planctomycetes bacterium]|nr:Na+/H+ antiporter subunit E [Planctomycetota bacterium]
MTATAGPLVAHRLGRFVSLFVFGALLWLAVTWSFDAASLAVGALLCAGVAWGLRRVELDEAPLLLAPLRLAFALAYLPVLLAYVVRANVDVAWRVLHPRLPIRPGIVRARTTLRSPSGRVLLANSITLTPGTLSVDLVGDVLYVHRICVPEQDPDGATERELRKFEFFIRRIFE